MSASRTRTAALAAAALAVAAPAIVTVSAAAADTAPQKCKGREVTIGGTKDDDKIVGTRHRDVIRTYKGDDRIKGRGGNDVICADRGADTLIGGRGNDRLHGGPFKLIDFGPEMGAKADRFLGGRGNDRIFGGGNPSNESDAVQPTLVTPDRVEFPAARGGIRVTKSGQVTGRGIGHDRLFGVQKITGTKWADRIAVRGMHVVAGEAGDDRVRVFAGKDDDQIWPTVVTKHGADRVDLSRSNQAYYEIHTGAGRDRITGSAKSELIFDKFGRGTVRGGGAYDQIGVTSKMAVHGQGGKDLLQITVKKGHRGSIDGGARHDRLALSIRAHGNVRLNVPAHRFRVGKVASRVRRVEAFGVPARHGNVTFIGNDRPNRLSTRIGKGRTVRARLGGGSDRFQVNTGPSLPDDPVGRAFVRGGRGADDLDGGLAHDRSRFSGGRGDDELDGSGADDVLRGGPGHDGADGWGGKDLCRAEEKSRCER